MQQGWIKLHRKIQDHWIYQEERKFSKYEAWLDLLMMASHKDTKFLLGKELIELKKGGLVTSELKLMQRWDWGKEKLRAFLKLLQDDGMITKESDRKKTTINICNYCIYHGQDEDSRPQTDHEQTDSRLSADTIKNVKNVKKKEYTPEFESFWDTYPRKKEKTKAFKCWNTRLKEGESPEKLLVCASNYANEVMKKGTEEQYIKLPATFLGTSKPYEDYEKLTVVAKSKPFNKFDYDVALQRHIENGGDPSEFAY